MISYEKLLKVINGILKTINKITIINSIMNKVNIHSYIQLLIFIFLTSEFKLNKQ